MTVGGLTTCPNILEDTTFCCRKRSIGRDTMTVGGLTTCPNILEDTTFCCRKRSIGRDTMTIGTPTYTAIRRSSVTKMVKRMMPSGGAR
nr:hypothetical protein Itr_chr01CG00550 [Ipomoea trifida]